MNNLSKGFSGSWMTKADKLARSENIKSAFWVLLTIFLIVLTVIIAFGIKDKWIFDIFKRKKRFEILDICSHHTRKGENFIHHKVFAEVKGEINDSIAFLQMLNDKLDCSPILYERCDDFTVNRRRDNLYVAIWITKGD